MGMGNILETWEEGEHDGNKRRVGTWNDLDSGKEWTLQVGTGNEQELERDGNTERMETRITGVWGGNGDR